MTVVLAETDVARLNPYRSGRGEPPVHFARFVAPRSAAVTQCQGRHELYHLPGGRRPPGSDGYECLGNGG